MYSNDGSNVVTSSALTVEVDKPVMFCVDASGFSPRVLLIGDIKLKLPPEPGHNVNNVLLPPKPILFASGEICDVGKILRDAVRKFVVVELSREDGFTMLGGIFRSFALARRDLGIPRW